MLHPHTLARRLPRLGRVAAPPARPVPVRLRWYVAAVSVGAALLVEAEFATIRPDLSRWTEQVSVGLVLMLFLARMFPVRMAPKRKVIVDTAPAFAAAIMLPPPLAATVGVTGMLVGELASGGRWFQALFNSALTGIKISVAALVFSLAAGELLTRDGDALIHIPALVAAAVAMHLTSTLLVDIAAGLTLARNPFSGWWAAQRRKAPVEVVLVLIGLFAALGARENPAVLPLLIVPAAIVYRSLRESVSERGETREALESLAQAVDLRHQRPVDHSRRVAERAATVARALGLSAEHVTLIADAARLRDVGEVTLPATAFRTSRPLTEEQRAEMRHHAQAGAEMVARFAAFASCAPLILHHHERWDGSGFPDGLAGDAIPFGSRVIAAAETWEAMMVPRPYRDALTRAGARAELRRAAGSQLDPAIADVLLGLLDREDGHAEQVTSVRMAGSRLTGEFS